MKTLRSRAIAVAAAVALVSGCAGPIDRGEEDEEVGGGPPPRTSWQLRHRVVESAALRVVGHGANAWGESTSVELARDDGTRESCGVRLPAPGYGGPEHWVGEQIPTTVRGRPAVRNGVGAEGGYVLWQAEDGSWVEVSCDELEDRRPVDQVVAAVRLRAAPLPVPFGFRDLPPDWAVSGVQEQEEVVQVYVGRDPRGTGSVPPTLEVRSGTGSWAAEPTGRHVTVGGHPALLDEDPRDPSVCVPVQDRHVCVFPTPDDMDRDADHVDQIPALLAVAGALTFAPDLADRSTWSTASRAFG